MITFLSGGTGTPKLLRGMQKVMDRHEIAVVVNTAEDIWISGNHISPDVDTVMYLFSGILNTDTWWGVRNDTFTTHDEVTRLGIDEFIADGGPGPCCPYCTGRDAAGTACGLPTRPRSSASASASAKPCSR